MSKIATLIVTTNKDVLWRSDKIV